MLSRGHLFATPWTVVLQALLSLGFSRQEYWSGLPFPAPGDLPNPGTEPVSPVSPALAGQVFTTEPPGKPLHIYSFTNKILVLFGIPFNYPKYSEEFPDPMDNWV